MGATRVDHGCAAQIDQIRRSIPSSPVPTGGTAAEKSLRYQFVKQGNRVRGETLRILLVADG